MFGKLLVLQKQQQLKRKTVGRQVYYQANPSCIIFQELVSILQKTSGLVDVLKEALNALTDHIDLAFVFGSIARDTPSSASDVDLLIVGDLLFATVVEALYPVQAVIRREINPKVYSKQEWGKMLENQDDFTKNILGNPKLFIIGSDNEFK